MNNKIQYMTGIALMSAVICLLGPIVIPIGIVPISFAGIGIYLSLFLLGRKRGAAAVLIYLFLGFMGLPVFSGFTAGPGRLLG
ncbi:MAG: biotin transporter BioY, partial [Lachnospiraceae bacterium]|nr:biotin transporter BioY [Lachnospiraceae bacterium]